MVLKWRLNIYSHINIWPHLLWIQSKKDCVKSGVWAGQGLKGPAPNLFGVLVFN